MALWLKKKKTESEKLLTFNIAELAKKLEVLQLDLFRYRNDDVYKMIEAVIDIAKNIQILEINRLHPTKDQIAHLAHQQGRLEALNDLAKWLMIAADDESHKDKVKSLPRFKGKVLVKKNQASEPVI